ncbi:MAG: apolipoprotein N-acyltransferase, partial [Ramlibacter sp.]
MKYLLPLAAVAGVAQALSIAAPWNGLPQWWLQLLSLAALVFILQRTPGWKQAALAGWIFATAWLAATFWWLFISMHVYGGLPAPLAILAVLGLAAFLALYYAAACAAFAWLGRGGEWSRAALFAALWLLAELARVTLFTG